jgi:hypothetical protein
MSRQEFQISNNIIWQEIAGIVSLYDSGSGDFYSLNEIGSKIWILASAGGDWDSITSKMIEDFAGNDTEVAIRILTDVKAFLSNMIERGWINSIRHD